MRDHRDNWLGDGQIHVRSDRARSQIAGLGNGQIHVRNDRARSKRQLDWVTERDHRDSWTGGRTDTRSDRARSQRQVDWGTDRYTE